MKKHDNSMATLNYKKLSQFIAADVIQPFYEIRLDRLQKATLNTILQRKNPYLFKAKNIETAGDLAKSVIDAFLSSQEETIFGDLMERLAIHICSITFNGKKAEETKFRSVDLIFERDNKVFIVGIKSGPNWGNSDQVNAMRRNFKKAKQILRAEGIISPKSIIAVNGCMYGRDNRPHKVNKKDPQLSYHKLCGQTFWELISGDKMLYQRIIQPVDKEAKKRDEIFKKLYIKKINEMTKDILELFSDDGILDWNKLVDYVSKNHKK